MDDYYYISTTSFALGNGTAIQGKQPLKQDFAPEDVVQDLLQAGYIELYEHCAADDVDLSDYIKYSDYATINRGGTITSGYGFNVNASNGKMSLSTLTAANYATQNDSYPISKGTLENVLAERLAA